jgi:DNA transformation protein
MGAIMGSVSSEYREYVLEQLEGLGGVIARAMFGGFGLYCTGRIFAIVFGDILYFKVDDSTRPGYEARGMARFRPYPDRPVLSMGYYEVPADVLEDRDECAVWARKAVAASAAKAAAKAGGRKSRSRDAARSNARSPGRRR